MMEWIKVKDKIPKDTIVLAFHKHIGRDVMYCADNGEWYLPEDWNNTPPTHWMTLPDDPKDNK